MTATTTRPPDTGRVDLTALDWSRWSKADVVALAASMFLELVREHGASEAAEAQRWNLAPRPPMNRRPACDPPA